ncbi:type II toxin-antitoxin system HipA family toxin [Rhodobacter capsulatus]|uniref:Serine/threonine-protein kinase HipA n=1 Tax=Rhodobacter capsulatus TaxID=1061 RepID=A0A1G7SR91_RHOCA|nr:type II toxin-antitoxin system HipA family toxin [Rhodobacter capsulatus]WER08590.1 type II toxin-antitoxin system HipA family toxin [Rhodobacter capsulatus]SDG25616.1 serine/threonine-protein kinase HipA [Rhodobacter capsulatus]
MPRLDLDVFLEACTRPIGRLTRFDDGALGFAYLTDALPHPLSLSLPLREEPFGDAVTRAFFSNLLFENAQRDQILQRYRLDWTDIVGQLEHLGADCPGAISCVPMGAGPAKTPGDLATDYDALDAQDLTRIMVSLRDRRRLPEDTRDPSPLAGVQGKVALTQLADGRFGLPKRGLNVPTTHILKVPRPSEMALVRQEHVLMSLMRGMQRHPVAETVMLGEGDLQGLLVTRFDRVHAGSTVHRLHQEDFAQALGLGPHLKYQRNSPDSHRFEARSVGALLAQTANPGRARQAFLEVTLVNLLLGNTDNHAKNHALLYTGARPELAPVYDVAPVLIDREVTHQLAFDIGSAQMTDEITGADLEDFIGALGFPRFTPALRKRLIEIVQAAVAEIGPMRGPGLKPLGDAMAEQAGWLAQALSAEIEIPERDGLIINRP